MQTTTKKANDRFQNVKKLLHMYINLGIFKLTHRFCGKLKGERIWRRELKLKIIILRIIFENNLIIGWEIENYNRGYIGVETS